ncbi:MAG: CARDB domain-containing protein, partial [Blastocatellales bacterium]
TVTPQSADLSLTKTVNNSTPNVGGTVIFTVTVSNAGPNNATNVAVKDLLPAGLTFVSSTPSQGSYNNVTGVWTVGTINNAASANIQITATVATAGAKSNYAQVSASDQNDPDSTPNDDSTTHDDDDQVTLTPQSSDLSLTKTVNNSTPNVGGNVTFTVTVTNGGPDTATNVTVKDVLPAGYTYVSDNGAGAYVSGTGIWTVGSLNNGQSKSLQITVKVNATGPYANYAQVQSSDQNDPDSTPGDDSTTQDDDDQVTPVPVPVADLAVQKNGPATVAANGTVVYTIRVSNAGPSAANGAAVTDPFPGALTSVSWVCDSETGGAVCGALSGNGNLNTTVATFPAGGSVTYTVTGTAPASGTFTNTATVAPPQGVTDPNTSNNTSSVTTGVGVVPTTADLAVVKSGPSTVAANGTVTYNIVVTNAGPGAANGAAFTDSPPLTGVTWTCGLETAGASCGTANGAGNISTTITTFPAGASVTFTVTGTAPASGTFTNTATVAPPQGVTDPDTSNNSSSATTTVQTPTTTADLYAIKTGPATVGPNATVTYKVIVGNSGPSGVTNAPFADNVPSALTGVTWTCGGATGGASCGTTNGAGNAISTTIASLPASSTVTFTITGTGPASGSFVNSATITPPVGTNDPDPTDNIGGPVITNVVVVADLSVTKTDGTVTYTPGLATTYTIVVTNNGPDGVTGAAVTDNIPSQVSSWTWVCSGSTGSATGCNGVTNSAANFTDTVDMPSGSTITYTVTATIPAGAAGNLVNTVAVAVPNGVTDPTPLNNSATDTDTAAPIADLSLSKTVNNSTPDVGTNVTFTITVTNSGPSNATGVEVKDLLPAGYTYVSDNGSGAYNSGTGIWTVGALTDGQSKSLQITATVKATGPYANYAQVTKSDQSDPDSTPNDNSTTQDDDDQVTPTPVPVADLSLNKTINNSTPDVGSNVTFTVTVTNGGPSSATGVEVKDLLPAGYTYVSDNGSGAYNSGTGIWTVGSLTNGQSKSLQITATVKATGPYANTAEVSKSNEKDPDSTPNNNNPNEDDQKSVTPTPVPVADLSLNKTINNSTPNVGSNVTFTITVTNGGPSSATGVEVKDLLPAGYTYVSDNGSGAYNSGTGVWTAGTLTNGQSKSLQITATVKATGPYANTAEVSKSNEKDPDSTPNNNNPNEDDQKSVTPAPAPVADLAITKTDGVTSVTSGNTTTYTIVVSNNGPSSANNAVFKDAAVAGLNVTGVTCGGASGGAACPAAGSVTVALMQGSGIVIPTLPSGGSVTFTVAATVTSQSSSVTNTATITPPNGVTDNGPNPNSASDTDTVVVETDLALTKTANNLAPKLGDIVTFTITIKNNGPGSASNIKVEDILQTGLVYVSSSASKGSYSSVTGVWTVGSLNANASATLQLRVRAEFGCCTVANTARIIDSSTPDSNSANNQASVTIGTPVGPGGNLPPSSEVSDQKAGSVLIYNFYTSSASQNSHNTRFNITNISSDSPIAVHLFFVDGSNCSVADMFLCLTPNQTTSFLASDLDPGTTGYVAAVAVDPNTGCPVYFNCLIGDEYVKLSSGHQANLGAEAISALTTNPAVCNENSNVATLNFDGVKYGRVPRALALSNIPSRADGNDTMLILNRIGGNLATGADTLTSIFGIFYDDTETGVSFSFTPSVCQFRSSISNNFPRIAPRFETLVPSGRSGWLKLYSTNDQGILGAAINFNQNGEGAAGAFSQGHNLHKLTLTPSASYTIPVIPPSC